MKRSSKLCFAVIAVASFAAAAVAQVRITEGGGKTLQDLVGTETYVTIWLNSGARDPNMRIRDIGDTYVGLIDINGAPTAHPLADIREIRVQKEVVQSGAGGGSRTIRLSADDQSIEERAIARAFELLNENKDNGALLMRAATLMAAKRGQNQQNAEAFLFARATSNDVPTSVAASLGLYVAGREVDTKIIAAGLASGARRTKAQAALLAGLTGKTEYIDSINELLQDPAAEIFPGAAIAAGLLKYEPGIDALVRNLSGLNDIKADAAVDGLILMGGDTVIATMRKLAEEDRGAARFRALRVLYAFGDPQAKKDIDPDRLREPGVAVEANILLCRDGDWDANNELRAELEKPRDPDLNNLILRARIAAALHKGGHAPAKGILQDLLRLQPGDVYSRAHDGDDDYNRETVIAVQVATCNLIAASESRSLMGLLQPAIESAYPEVAMAACEAAVCIADAGYRERMLKVRLLK